MLRYSSAFVSYDSFEDLSPPGRRCHASSFRCLTQHPCGRRAPPTHDDRTHVESLSLQNNHSGDCEIPEAFALGLPMGAWSQLCTTSPASHIANQRSPGRQPTVKLRISPERVSAFAVYWSSPLRNHHARSRPSDCPSSRRTLVLQALPGSMRRSQYWVVAFGVRGGLQPFRAPRFFWQPPSLGSRLRKWRRLRRRICCSGGG